MFVLFVLGRGSGTARRILAVTRSKKEEDRARKDLDEVVCPGCIGRRDKGGRRKRKGGEDVPEHLARSAHFTAANSRQLFNLSAYTTCFFRFPNEYRRSEFTDAGSSYSFQSYRPILLPRFNSSPRIFTFHMLYNFFDTRTTWFHVCVVRCSFKFY